MTSRKEFIDAVVQTATVPISKQSRRNIKTLFDSALQHARHQGMLPEEIETTRWNDEFDYPQEYFLSALVVLQEWSEMSGARSRNVNRFGFDTRSINQLTQWIITGIAVWEEESEF